MDRECSDHGGQSEVEYLGLSPEIGVMILIPATEAGVSLNLPAQDVMLAENMGEAANRPRQPSLLTPARERQRLEVDSVVVQGAVGQDSETFIRTAQGDQQLPRSPRTSHDTGTFIAPAMESGQAGGADVATAGVHVASGLEAASSSGLSFEAPEGPHMHLSSTPVLMVDLPLHSAAQSTHECQDSAPAAGGLPNAREPDMGNRSTVDTAACLPIPVAEHSPQRQQVGPVPDSALVVDPAPMSQGPGPPLGGHWQAPADDVAILAEGDADGVGSSVAEGRVGGPHPGQPTDAQEELPGGQPAVPGPISPAQAPLAPHGPHIPHDATSLGQLVMPAMAANNGEGYIDGGVSASTVAGHASSADSDSGGDDGSRGDGGGRDDGGGGTGDRGGGSFGSADGGGAGSGADGGGGDMRGKKRAATSAAADAGAGTSKAAAAGQACSLVDDDDEDGEGSPCPICLETMTSSGDHQACCLKCGHLYGKHCIQQWLRRSRAKCPACNAPAKASDIRVIFAGRAIKVVDNADSSADVAAMQRKLEEERANRARVEAEALATRNKYKAQDDDLKRLKRELARTQALLSVANQQTVAQASSWQGAPPPLVAAGNPIEFLRSCITLTAASMGAPLGPARVMGWSGGHPQGPYTAGVPLGPTSVPPENRIPDRGVRRHDALGPGATAGVDYRPLADARSTSQATQPHTGGMPAAPAARSLSDHHGSALAVDSGSHVDASVVEPWMVVPGRGPHPAGERDGQGGAYAPLTGSLRAGNHGSLLASTEGTSHRGRATWEVERPLHVPEERRSYLQHAQGNPAPSMGQASSQLNGSSPETPWPSAPSRTLCVTSAPFGPSLTRPTHAASARVGQRTPPGSVGVWQAPSATGVGQLAAFSLQATLTVTNARVMDIAPSAQLLVLSEEIDRAPSCRKVSVLDPGRGSQAFKLPADSGATRDLRLSRTTSPSCAPSLLLVAGFGKQLSIMSLDSGYPIVKFRTLAPVWSCEWHREDPNVAFAGLADGSVLQLDMRQTRGPVSQTHAPRRQPVHSLFHTSGAEWAWWASGERVRGDGAAAGASRGERGGPAGLFGRRPAVSAPCPGMLVAATLNDVWTVQDAPNSAPATLFRPELATTCTSLALERDAGTLVASFRAPSTLGQPTCDVACPAPQGCHFVFMPTPGLEPCLDFRDQNDGHNLSLGASGPVPSFPTWQRAEYVPTGSVSNSVMSRSSIVVRSRAASADRGTQTGASAVPLLASGDDSCNGVRLLGLVPPASRVPHGTIGCMDTCFDSLLAVPHLSPVLDVQFVSSVSGGLLASLSTSRLHLYS